MLPPVSLISTIYPEYKLAKEQIIVHQSYKLEPYLGETVENNNMLRTYNTSNIYTQ